MNRIVIRAAGRKWKLHPTTPQLAFKPYWNRPSGFILKIQHYPIQGTLVGVPSSGSKMSYPFLALALAKI